MRTTHPSKAQAESVETGPLASDQRSEAGAAPSPHSLEEWLDWLEPVGQEIVSSGRILIEVRKDRLRLRVRRVLMYSVGIAAVSLGMALWIGSAALATVRGLCGAVTAWSGGDVWFGDLFGGVLALVLAALAAATVAFLVSRREWKLAKVKYEKIRSGLADDSEAGASAPDSRTTVGPRGTDGATCADNLHPQSQ
jgi:hypothetical protein